MSLFKKSGQCVQLRQKFKCNSTKVPIFKQSTRGCQTKIIKTQKIKGYREKRQKMHRERGHTHTIIHIVFNIHKITDNQK